MIIKAIKKDSVVVFNLPGLTQKEALKYARNNIRSVIKQRGKKRLYNWKFELLSVIAHARHLYRKFGAWPHTISVPRLQPAPGSPLASPPYPVSDNEFKLIVALYRLAVPTAGIVVST